MPIITDPEFGEIVVRSSSASSRISLKIAPDGRLRASVPRYTSLLAVKTLLKTSRKEIRQLIAQHQEQHGYTHSQPIGKSHSLLIQNTTSLTSIELNGTKIIASLGLDEDIADTKVQSDIRSLVLKVLRKEAKSYLPRRLSYLAQTHGYSYSSVKITHASSRWGSCSSAGTISLNIALMKLPFELLDYILIHELCHTVHMNHSQDFWQAVQKASPNYKQLRSQLKKHTPSV